MGPLRPNPTRGSTSAAPGRVGSMGVRISASQCVGRYAGECSASGLETSYAGGRRLTSHAGCRCVRLRPPSLQQLASAQSSGLIIRFNSLSEGSAGQLAGQLLISRLTPGQTVRSDWGSNTCLPAIPINGGCERCGTDVGSILNYLRTRKMVARARGGRGVRGFVSHPRLHVSPGEWVRSGLSWFESPLPNFPMRGASVEKYSVSRLQTWMSQRSRASQARGRPGVSCRLPMAFACDLAGSWRLAHWSIWSTGIEILNGRVIAAHRHPWTSCPAGPALGPAILRRRFASMWRQTLLEGRMEWIPLSERICSG